MTLKRWSAKRDAAEAPIVRALRQAGYEVWLLDSPCDLLLRLPRWEPGRFLCLEVKSGTRKADPRQSAQSAFLAATGTPVVRTPEQALCAAGAL